MGRVEKQKLAVKTILVTFAAIYTELN